MLVFGSNLTPRIPGSPTSHILAKSSSHGGTCFVAELHIFERPISLGIPVAQLPPPEYGADFGRPRATRLQGLVSRGGIYVW